MGTKHKIHLPGSPPFYERGFLRAQKGFDASCMSKDLTGRVCLVTGANSGIGYEVTKELALRGAEVYMVVRDEDKGKVALEEIQEVTSSKMVFLKVCDMSSLAAIRGLADEFDSKKIRLYLLVNNAGCMVTTRETSTDGYELNFATNTLGTFLLTHAMSPCLEREAPAARVVTITSGGAYTEPLVIEDLEMNSAFDGTVQYARDKRRQIALMERFAERLAPSGVGCYLMHPGWVDTPGLALSLPGFHKTFQKQLRTLDQGADTAVWLALQDNADLQSGGLYLDRKLQVKHMYMAGTQYDASAVDDLWARLCEMADLEPATEDVSLATDDVDQKTEAVGVVSAPSAKGQTENAQAGRPNEQDAHPG